MKRALLHSACALLLVVAQIGALEHAIWHLRDHVPGHQHGSAGAAQQGDDQRGSQSRLCDLHFAMGALFAGDCGAPLSLAATAPDHLLAAPAATWRLAEPAATPRSRAPPVLL